MEFHSCVILKLTLQDAYNFTSVNLPFALTANENVNKFPLFRKIVRLSQKELHPR